MMKVQSNNQNKIQNPNTQVPKTPEMNDRDRLNDMLATEKYMTDGYDTALNEASHATLYEDILSIYTETQNCQRDIFNLMFQKGWYKMNAASGQQLQQSYQQFNNYMTTQFPH